MKFTKTHESLLIIVITIAAFIFWNSIILFPVKLVSVIFHEFSHVIAAFCTGGSVISLEITNQLGGTTTTKNTNEIIVLLSGYTGSLLLGGFFYLSTIKQKYTRYFLPVLATFYLILGLVFIKNEFGIISSVIISLFFISLAFIKSPILLSLILKTLSLLSISYVINDIIYDTFLTTNFFSDPVRLEQLTGVNDWIWGIIWILLAVSVLTSIVWDLFKLKRR